MIEVIVKVEGGIAEVVQKPAGVRVTIVDLDVESEDQVVLGGAVEDAVLVADAETLDLIVEARSSL